VLLRTYVGWTDEPDTIVHYFGLGGDITVVEAARSDRFYQTSCIQKQRDCHYDTHTHTHTHTHTFNDPLSGTTRRAGTRKAKSMWISLKQEILSGSGIRHQQVSFLPRDAIIRGTSHGPVSVCVCPSVTSRSSTKTAKRRITKTTPHDAPKTLFF